MQFPRSALFPYCSRVTSVTALIVLLHKYIIQNWIRKGNTYLLQALAKLTAVTSDWPQNSKKAWLYKHHLFKATRVYVWVHAAWQWVGLTHAHTHTHIYTHGHAQSNSLWNAHPTKWCVLTHNIDSKYLDACAWVCRKPVALCHYPTSILSHLMSVFGGQQRLGLHCPSCRSPSTSPWQRVKLWEKSAFIVSASSSSLFKISYLSRNWGLRQNY